MRARSFTAEAVQDDASVNRDGADDTCRWLSANGYLLEGNSDWGNGFEGTSFRPSESAPQYSWLQLLERAGGRRMLTADC